MNIAFKPLAKALAASVFLSSLVLTAHANTVVLTQAVLQESPQQQGGEFVANSATLSNASYAASAQVAGGGFYTFCMAYDQEFSYGQSLTYILTNHTDDTSAGTRTALTGGVAWLYSQFAQGNILITTGAQDTDFQDAIWYLQNSNGAPSTLLTNQYLVAAKAAFSGSLANAELAAGSNNYGVQIILTGYGTYSSTTDSFSGGYAQPQLYYSRVPEAGSTVALLGLSLLGIAGFRRKFATAK